MQVFRQLNFSIIIPSIGRRSLRALVEETASQIRQYEIDAEILVGTSVPTVHSLLHGLNCRIVWTHSGSAVENRNACAAVAGKDFLLFWDDDCIPDAGVLRAYLHEVPRAPSSMSTLR